MNKPITIAGAAMAALMLMTGSGCGEQGGGETAAVPVETPSAPAPAAAPAAPEAVAPVEAASTPAERGPRLTFERQRHEFGQVWDIEEQEVVFRFRNTGDETVKIESVKTSCGCTAAELPKKIYGPGEGDEIRVSYKPKGIGVQSQNIRIMANTPVPLTTLTIMADVRPFVRVEPQYVRMGNLALGEEHTARFTATSVDPNMVIDALQPNSPFISARLVNDSSGPRGPNDPGRPAEVEVTVKPTAKWGNFYAAVTLKCRGRLETGGEEIHHDVKVSISAKIFGDVEVDDTMFRLVNIEKNSPFERRIRVTNNKGAEFTATAEIARCTLKQLDVSVEPVREPGISAYDIVLRGDSTGHRGPIRGDVVVLTDVPGEQRFQLQIAGRVKD